MLRNKIERKVRSARNHLERNGMLKKLLATVAALSVVAGAVFASPAFAAASLTGLGSSYANKFIVGCDAASSDFTVNYQPNGSGAGRTAFTGSTVDFGASDSATAGLTLSGARAGGKFSYVPVVGGPIAIAFNLKSTGIKTKSLKLTAPLIAKIFAGKIKMWNSKAIKQLQPAKVAAKLPNRPIQVVYRGASSGTSDNFTNYMSQTAPAVWSWAHNSLIYGTGSATAPAGALSATNAADLLTKVKNTEGTIGYADLADTVNSNGNPTVTVALVKNAKGEFVGPTAKASGLFLQEFYDDNFNAKTGAVTLDYTKAIAGAYNLSLITYLMVDKGVDAGKSLPSGAKASDVEDFARYLLKTCGPTTGAKLGYAAISGNLKTAALTLVANITG